MTPGAISGRDDASGGWSGSARVQLADVPRPPSPRAPALQQGSRDASLKNVGERDDGWDDETTTSRGVGAAWGDGWADVAFASLGQAAAASGFGIVVASLAVATERRTGSEAVGTLALAVEMFARAVASLPAARRANARGRREVIAHAGCLGVLGSLVAFADFYLDSHVLYFLGISFVGVANCVAQQLRFAAAEAVAPAHRPRALSFGVAGGTLAAFIGPEVAKATRTALAEEFAACFLAMAGCYAALVAFTSRIRSAGPRLDGADDASSSLAWPSAELARSVNARKGLAGVTCAWTAMFLVMSAAPLAMTGRREGGHSFDEAATALQLHMIAMFLPGLLGTGDVVRRFGPDAVSNFGCALYVVCAAFTYAAVPDATGHGERVPLWAFHVLLIILGLAWNLTFIAGSALMLPDGVVLDAAGSRRVQGAAEAATFFAVGTASAIAGATLGAIGWRGLCACVAPFAVGMAWYGWSGAGGGAGGRVPAGRGCGDGDGDGEASASKFHLRSVL
ncbi:major facilitator superfamily [Micromonas commoda]|uniref:Major facilitator superfamily n=1 Tax=Micromonas commoda (strain RCC299 / NOUM17 / CCMP2709) TaxID=296587 RepID=C1E6Y3_MICCC|nr:major facilitator superfamily [Micromonas commoda]ACO63886.1 major facilitator superfamily [Micromonas commoda]|eukprot:XP_002502628.1 major facilitator superfamily [Micromonas commoda]